MHADSTATISIEVAYALPDRQQITALDVTIGTTAIDAVKISKIETLFSQIDVHNVALGIFGKKIIPEYVLQNKDRVEIYRPLLIDPQTARLNRLKKAQHKK